MALSNALAQAILNSIYRHVDLVSPTRIWMSLHTADPGSTGASESADATYARVEVTSAWAAPSGTSIANNAVINYGPLTAGATFTFVGFWTAATSGTFLRGFALTSLVIAAGERPYFSAGDLTDSIA